MKDIAVPGEILGTGMDILPYGNIQEGDSIMAGRLYLLCWMEGQ